MDDLLKIIDRKKEIFDDDVLVHERQLASKIEQSSFLIIGGAGSVGQAVAKEIFRRRPKKLHIVDISENNLVELVRDIRSTLGYISGEFLTLPLDCGTKEFQSFLSQQDGYDYIFNLSAMKHVRSEKDPFSMMRMLGVNVLNTEVTLAYAANNACRKYFAVSTDKAVNPVSVMGATKSVMEACLMRASRSLAVSTARFANVAFSDGSLLHGFLQRFQKVQPLSAPNDIKRYFITSRESGQLCLMSGLLGENRDVFFPKMDKEIHLTDFPGIAMRFLECRGYEPFICATEDEARNRMKELYAEGKWPCYFFSSDTGGEKEYEEFYSESETLDLKTYQSIGVIKRDISDEDQKNLERFLLLINELKAKGEWKKEDIMEPLFKFLPDFKHNGKSKSLDNRM